MSQIFGQGSKYGQIYIVLSEDVNRCVHEPDPGSGVAEGGDCVSRTSLGVSAAGAAAAAARRECCTTHAAVTPVTETHVNAATDPGVVNGAGTSGSRDGPRIGHGGPNHRFWWTQNRRRGRCLWSSLASDPPTFNVRGENQEEGPRFFNWTTSTHITQQFCGRDARFGKGRKGCGGMTPSIY